MKKKFFALIATGALALTALTGCSSNEAPANPSTGDTSVAEDSTTEDNTSTPQNDLLVGMVTDAGTIDDKSFNQGTWEGIGQAEAEFGISSRYLQPAGTTHADYMNEISNLYDAGYRFLVTPGFKFETAILEAQERYEDAKFVLIDGAPNNADYDGEYVEFVADNTVSIFFAEHEAGFLAGVATAVELGEAEVGFIGGMEIPSVQKFNWGFQHGINYANENLDTNITLNENNVVYQGTFDDVPAGQQIAGAMYDRGVDAIFTAAGGVGVGAITEATERAENGQEVWVIGVDSDQYDDGIYGSEGNSVILTSAMKKVDVVTYDMIAAELNGDFPGGQTLNFDLQNDGVGLPEENPNLSAETIATVDEIIELIVAGDIVVADNNDDGLLIK